MSLGEVWRATWRTFAIMVVGTLGVALVWFGLNKLGIWFGAAVFVLIQFAIQCGHVVDERRRS